MIPISPDYISLIEAELDRIGTSYTALGPDCIHANVDDLDPSLIRVYDDFHSVSDTAINIIAKLAAVADNAGYDAVWLALEDWRDAIIQSP